MQSQGKGNKMSGIDVFYRWYFLIHIPMTAVMDSCLLIKEENRLPIQQFLNDVHISMNKDFLMVDTPLWLKVFGLFELAFQLPLFVIGASMLKSGNKKIYPWMIVYGFNASFTTLVCLVYVWAEGPANGLNVTDMVKLLLVYIPFLIIPAMMLVDYSCRVMRLVEPPKQKSQ